MHEQDGGRQERTIDPPMIQTNRRRNAGDNVTRSGFPAVDLHAPVSGDGLSLRLSELVAHLPASLSSDDCCSFRGGCLYPILRQGEKRRMRGLETATQAAWGEEHRGTPRHHSQMGGVNSDRMAHSSTERATHALRLQGGSLGRSVFSATLVVRVPAQFTAVLDRFIVQPERT